MNISPQLVESIVRQVIAANGSGTNELTAPIGISNRHLHLTQEHVEILFGKGYELQKLKDLSQPGQYACKETVTIIGPSMRSIEGVRVLGPVRPQTQVEISRTDSFTLKVKPPVRESGKITGSAPVTIVGPKGVVTISEGCIIANRHIHMSLEDGARFGVKDCDYVTVELNGERRTTFYDVQIRVHKDFRLEMHIDTDDANAAGVKNGDKAVIIK